MKMIVLTTVAILSALASLVCGLRGLTISKATTEGLRKKKTWFFMQRTLMTGFFAFMLGTLGPGDEGVKTLQFYFYVFVVVVGLVGIMIEYAAVLRGKDTPLKSSSESTQGTQKPNGGIPQQS